MKWMHRPVILAATAAIACIAQSETALAQAPTASPPVAPSSPAPDPNQAKLIALLTQMGYSPVTSGGLVKYVTRTQYEHVLYTGTDGNLYDYIPLMAIPVNKYEQIPYEKALTWGLNKNSYFTMHVSAPGAAPLRYFFINLACGSSTSDINIATLVKCSAEIEADAAASRDLWDPTNWK